jgi:hypothetical protein
MKLHAHIPEEEWHKIERWIDCDFSNPMEDEYIFVDPKPMLIWRICTITDAFGWEPD